jgi:hypothetical protein
MSFILLIVGEYNFWVIFSTFSLLVHEFSAHMRGSDPNKTNVWLCCCAAKSTENTVLTSVKIAVNSMYLLNKI